MSLVAFYYWKFLFYFPIQRLFSQISSYNFKKPQSLSVPKTSGQTAVSSFVLDFMLNCTNTRSRFQDMYMNERHGTGSKWTWASFRGEISTQLPLRGDMQAAYAKSTTRSKLFATSIVIHRSIVLRLALGRLAVCWSDRRTVAELVILLLSRSLLFLSWCSFLPFNSQDR